MVESQNKQNISIKYELKKQINHEREIGNRRMCIEISNRVVSEVLIKKVAFG